MIEFIQNRTIHMFW